MSSLRPNDMLICLAFAIFMGTKRSCAEMVVAAEKAALVQQHSFRVHRPTSVAALTQTPVRVVRPTSLGTLTQKYVVYDNLNVYPPSRGAEVGDCTHAYRSNISAKDCVQWCEEAAWCACVVYRESNQRCWRRIGCSTGHGRLDSRFKVSVKLSTSLSNFKSTQTYRMYENLNVYPGLGAEVGDCRHDFRSNMSAVDCKQWCDEADWCECVAYRVSNQRCWRRAGCDPESGRQDAAFKVFAKARDATSEACPQDKAKSYGDPCCPRCTKPDPDHPLSSSSSNTLGYAIDILKQGTDFMRGGSWKHFGVDDNGLSPFMNWGAWALDGLFDWISGQQKSVEGPWIVAQLEKFMDAEVDYLVCEFREIIGEYFSKYIEHTDLCNFNKAIASMYTQFFDACSQRQCLNYTNLAGDRRNEEANGDCCQLDVNIENEDCHNANEESIMNGTAPCRLYDTSGKYGVGVCGTDHKCYKCENWHTVTAYLEDIISFWKTDDYLLEGNMLMNWHSMDAIVAYTKATSFIVNIYSQIIAIGSETSYQGELKKVAGRAAKWLQRRLDNYTTVGLNDTVLKSSVISDFNNLDTLSLYHQYCVYINPGMGTRFGCNSAGNEYATQSMIQYGWNDKSKRGGCESVCVNNTNCTCTWKCSTSRSDKQCDTNDDEMLWCCELYDIGYCPDLQCYWTDPKAKNTKTSVFDVVENYNPDKCDPAKVGSAKCKGDKALWARVQHDIQGETKRAVDHLKNVLLKDVLGNISKAINLFQDYAANGVNSSMWGFFRKNNWYPKPYCNNSFDPGDATKTCTQQSKTKS